MTYTRKCWWCGKEFETNDVELDFCSIECFHEAEAYNIAQLEAYNNIAELEEKES